jgi:hypothetical protein
MDGYRLRGGRQVIPQILNELEFLRWTQVEHRSRGRAHPDSPHWSGAQFLFEAQSLDLRTFSSARVPQCQNLDDILSLNTIVEMIVNSSEVKAPHVCEIGVRCSRTDIGLRSDELKSSGQLLPEQVGSCLAVLIPPTGGFADLTFGKGDNP